LPKTPDWIIEPQAGIGPIRFGMRADEVARHLGPVEFVREIGDGKGRPRKGSFTELRSATKLPVLTYEASGLVLADFMKSARTLSLDGLLLFAEPRQAIIDRLIATSSNVYRSFEGYDFLDYGLTMLSAENARGTARSGHWNIGVFARGYRDALMRDGQEHGIGHFIKGGPTVGRQVREP